MIKSLMPKEYKFYDYFENHIEIVIKASQELRKINKDGSNLIEVATIIQEYERQADKITWECKEVLHKTFITPFERTDILHLITRLDDIIDAINGAISRLSLYNINEIRPEVQEITKIIENSCLTVQKAIFGIRNLKKSKEIIDNIIKIRDYEEEGDVMFKQAISKLFSENNAIEIIKWKEIYERLEKAIDRCENVANIIEYVLIDNA